MILINNFNKWFKKSGDSLVIICFHKLGDSVFTIPTIEKIKENFNNEINLFCMKDSAPIYKFVFGDSLNYFSFTNEDFWLGGRISKSKVRKCFKKRNASLVIDLTSSSRSVSTFILNRAEIIVGFNHRVFKSLYSIYNSIDTINHISEIYAKAVQGLVEVDYPLSKFNLEKRNDGDILIHPFAGWTSKEWGIYKFVALAKKINKIRTTKFIIPANLLPEDVMKEVESSGIKIIQTDTIGELIDHFKRASLIIGNDSGTIYIANLMGIPTFTIFGPSNPTFHYVPSEISDFINNFILCSPGAGDKLCFTNGGRDGCPVNLCMTGLSLETVYRKVTDLLKKI